MDVNYLRIALLNRAPLRCSIKEGEHASSLSSQISATRLGYHPNCARCHTYQSQCNLARAKGTADKSISVQRSFADVNNPTMVACRCARYLQKCVTSMLSTLQQTVIYLYHLLVLCQFLATPTYVPPVDLGHHKHALAANVYPCGLYCSFHPGNTK